MMSAVVAADRERMEVREPSILEYAPVVEPATRRIVGFDLARAFAIFAMIVDHCAQALGPRQPTGWGAKLLALIDGRASATFVVLAGVGVSLLARSHSAAEVRAVLVRRGAFLLAIGFVNQAIWPGDILRLFGVTMMAAGFLVGLNNRALLGTAIAAVLVFPVLMALFNYDERWNWATFYYEGLWTPVGAFRNVFYDGFRPVFPWAGLLILGMWVGRLDVTRASIRWRLLFWGVGLTAAIETVSKVALTVLLKHPGPLSEDTIRNLFETGSMPPLPVFVLTVVGTALTVIAIALMAGARWPKAKLSGALTSTGQMALTWYIFHILVGAAWVWKRGWHSAGTVSRGILVGAVLFALIVVVSTLWKRRFRYGPLEWVLRNVSN